MKQCYYRGLSALVSAAICLTVATAAAQTYPDPVGDTFGVGLIQHDLTSSSAVVGANEIVFTLSFSDLVAAASTGSTRAAVGFVDLDIDQIAESGITVADLDFATSRGGSAVRGDLGIEYYVDLFGDITQPGFASLVDATTRQAIADVPLSFTANSLSVTVPRAWLGTDAALNYGVLIGTLSEPTDELIGASVVPEPSGIALASMMTIGLAGASRYRRNKR